MQGDWKKVNEKQMLIVTAPKILWLFLHSTEK
jgi:hypothetical protein